MIRKQNMCIHDGTFVSYQTTIIKDYKLLRNPYGFSQTTSRHFNMYLKEMGFELTSYEKAKLRDYFFTLKQKSEDWCFDKMSILKKPIKFTNEEIMKILTYLGIEITWNQKFNKW